MSLTQHLLTHRRDCCCSSPVPRRASAQYSTKIHGKVVLTRAVVSDNLISRSTSCKKKSPSRLFVSFSQLGPPGILKRFRISCVYAQVQKKKFKTVLNREKKRKLKMSSMWAVK